MSHIYRTCTVSPHRLMPIVSRRRILAPSSTTIPIQSQFFTQNKSYQSYHSTHYKPASERVDRIFDKILQLDTVEVHLLTELINEKMGIRPMTAAQRAAMSNGGNSKAATAAAEPVEEKKIFDVKLTGFDASGKIKVIKEIRSITGLGLKEAKELVEGVPKVIKKDIKMDEAEDIKAKLEAVGATIEIS